MSSIFRTDGVDIYLEANYCEFYIPMYYFESTKKFAQDFVNRISVIGFFNVGIFSNGKLKEMKTLNLPTTIDINVYDSEVRNVQLPNNQEVQCKVIKYYKDNKIMSDVIFENSTESESYLSFITSGSLPKTIPYSKALTLWRKNMELNNVHFGVASCVLELILSVVYRSPKNMKDKFSKVIGQNDSNVSEYDYQVASIRQICQYASTFTALTYEDFDSMVTTSLNRGKDKEVESPVEKIIKF